MASPAHLPARPRSRASRRAGRWVGTCFAATVGLSAQGQTMAPPSGGEAFAQIRSLDRFEAEQERLRELLRSQPAPYQDQFLQGDDAPPDPADTANDASQPEGLRYWLAEAQGVWSRRSQSGQGTQRSLETGLRLQYQQETLNHGEWVLQADTRRLGGSGQASTAFAATNDARGDRFTLRNLGFPLTPSAFADLGAGDIGAAAQQIARAESRPKRSLLFVAVTAEEKGLLGSDWFAQRPTVPRDSLVANVNLDMPVLLTPTTDVVPIGIEHSTLQPLVAQAAKDVGVQLSPDPFPEEVVFVRSDQFSFIRAGIPAVYLDGGVVGTGSVDGKAAFEDFLRGHYHRPSDDTSLPIQYADAARLARLNARIGQLIADARDRPAWNPGDFFGERYARKPADAASTPAVAPAKDAAAGAAR